MSYIIKHKIFSPGTDIKTFITEDYQPWILRNDMIKESIKRKDDLSKNDPEIIKQTKDLNKLLKFAKYYRMLSTEKENQKYAKEESELQRRKTFSVKKRSKSRTLKSKRRKSKKLKINQNIK